MEEQVPENEATIEELTDALAAPLAGEREVNKGNYTATYVPYAEVVARLNKVLGVGNWGFQVINTTIYPDQDFGKPPEWVTAHVRLVLANGMTVDGVGGQKVKYKSNEEIVDLGDELKGAVSDAVKKAAQALGVGLYLARDPEAAQAEELNPQRQMVFNAINELDNETREVLADLWQRQELPKVGDLSQAQIAQALDLIEQVNEVVARTPEQDHPAGGPQAFQEPQSGSDGPGTGVA